jgi:hypothetical protein
MRFTRSPVNMVTACVFPKCEILTTVNSATFTATDRRCECCLCTKFDSYLVPMRSKAGHDIALLGLQECKEKTAREMCNNIKVFRVKWSLFNRYLLNNIYFHFKTARKKIKNTRRIIIDLSDSFNWHFQQSFRWYCRDRVSSCNIYAVQQDTQSVLMSNFIHHVS